MATKMFTGSSLALFAAWILADFVFIVALIPRSPDIGTVLLLFFYIMFPIALYVIMLGLAFLRQRREEVTELFAIDLPRAAFAIMIGAVGTFIVLLFTVGLWQDFHPIPLDLVLLQAIIIVPSEEFSFRFFLPRVMPSHPLGVPAWIWAQISFALFHFQAFNFDLFAIAFAFAFGIFLFLVADAKRKGGSGKVPLLGLGGAIGVHFVWNLVSLSTGGTIGGLASLLGGV